MKLRATAQQQLWPSQLGLCWFDLEVLQLHGHAHVPRDLQLPLEERLNGRDGETAQIKKTAWDPITQQLARSLQGLRRETLVRELQSHPHCHSNNKITNQMLILTRTMRGVLSHQK